MKISKFALFASLIPFFAHSNEVSFTIDDPGAQSALNMNRLQVGERILKSLREHKLKTVLFVCGMKIDNHEGKELLDLWDKENHVFGNHTYSHQNYNTEPIDYAYFTNDILKNEKIIEKYKSFKKIFRYPFLKEGDTALKRDQMRSFLKEKGYSHGQVTVDASDWYISDRLVKKLNKGEKVNLEAYKKYYLDHIWDRAQFYNELSKKVIGKKIKHNILIHHNVLNAYFLGDLIQMFKDKGWDVIDASKAFQDPIYGQLPKNVPAGESLFWGLAKESGKYESLLRYPAEDGSYQQDEMDKLGL